MRKASFPMTRSNSSSPIQVEGDRFRYYDFPVNQMFGVQSSLPNFMAQTHQVNNAADAENYIKRLDQFPQNFSQVIEGLKLREAKGVIPPKFTVDKVLEQMNGFIGDAGRRRTCCTRASRRSSTRSTPTRWTRPTRDDLLGAGQGVDRRQRLSGVSRSDRLFHGPASRRRIAESRRLEPARRRCLLRLVRAQPHDDRHDAGAGPRARPGRSRADQRGDGCDPARQGPDRGQHRRARAAAGARSPSRCIRTRRKARRR